MGYYGYGWRPYVSVAKRRLKAKREMVKLRKKGVSVFPVEIEGRKIARTLWGEAWCKHLESFSDYVNRLPRGRIHVRNGSVCHLDIAKGKVKAIVSGSDLYKVAVKITPLVSQQWREVKKRCAGQIGSLLELLQGKLSAGVMEVVTDRNNGLFPLPKEISLDCDCPDWAGMCKHVAAVLYGVGARLDEKPELLFLLRGVDHKELIGTEVEAAAESVIHRGGRRKKIAAEDLSNVFGIDIAPDDSREEPSPKSGGKKATAKKVTKKAKAARRKTVRKKILERTARKATNKTAKKSAGKSIRKVTAKAKKKAAKRTSKKTPQKSAKPAAHKATANSAQNTAKQPLRKNARKAAGGTSTRTG